MELSPFKLERYFAKYEFNTEYLLCSSDCESWSLEELLSLEEGAGEAFKRTWLGYTESSGAPSLRAEISRLYSGIDPGDVLVHSGAEEAIFLFMHAMLQAGDHVIVHSPCYQSLFEVARSIGCRITLWQARPEAGWALDLDELRKALKRKTRLVIVNTPHNPTGYLMPPQDQQAMVRMLQDYGVILFSDEVYRGLEYDPTDRLPAGCDLDPQAASLGVMSKSYGLAGLRIGWIASRNKQVIERMAALKDYTTICNSAPSEYLAELALRQGTHLVNRNLEIIRSNLALLDAFFERRADRFEWTRPRAGPIAFPRLTGEQIGSFCHRLVTRAGVLLLPGTLYDHPGNHFRIGFARRNMPKGLAKLEAFLDV